MTNLSFWAQSLDNESPDFIYRNGEELLDEDMRQQFVSEIYDFPAKKLELKNSPISTRYSVDSDPKFIIEAIPFQKDQANRLAPVLIYGEFPHNPPSQWVEQICNEIEKFIQDKLGRTLDSDTLNSIQNWLNKTLDEKKKSKGFNWSTSVILGILVTSVVIGLFQSQGWKLSNVQIAGLIAFSNTVVISLQIFSTSKLNRRLKAR